MARAILVNGWNLPVRNPDFDFAEAARNGEVATGGINMDSENAGWNINSHWTVTAQDLAAPSDFFYVGYVADKDISRGPFSINRDRQFDTNLVDLNTLLINDIITGSGGNRPEESDIDRVTWLVGTSFLYGMGATIGASGSTTLEAADYRTQNPLSLLTQAAETSGKMFFVYWDHVTDAPKLFYDLATASNFVTSSKISTVLSDGSNSLTHHPVKASMTRSLDGGRIYSEVLFKYDGGSVTVTNTATASNYMPRKTVVYDNSVKTEAHATRKANKYLNAASTEEDTIVLDVILEPQMIHEFRAGQMMQVKAPHLGLPSFVDRRIVRRSVKPSTDTDVENYLVTLELVVPTANRWGDRGVATDLLPDDVVDGGGPSNPADFDYGTNISVVAWDVHRNNTGSGAADVDSGATGGVGIKAGSWVYNNVAYTSSEFPCSIGGGSFKGWWDRTTWLEFTAPADGDWLGLVVTIDASAYNTNGFVTQFELALYNGQPAAGMLWDGQGFGVAPTAGSIDVYIPRSLVDWNATNALGFRPLWRCIRPTQFCNAGGYFGTPEEDGRASSGSGEDWTISALRTIFWASGTTGVATDIAAKGEVDGSNTVFELIGWDGTGSPSFSINGLAQPPADVIFDTVLMTATLTYAPPTGSILLWTYNVAA